MLNNLKKRMYEMISVNSIKVNVSEEDVYLKKSKFPTKEWHVFYSPIDLSSVENATDEQGNIDWNLVRWNKVNAVFGGKSNAIFTFIVGILAVGVVVGVKILMNSYGKVMSNPQVQQCIQNAGIKVLIG